MFSDICFPHISLHELIFLIPHYRSLAHYGSVHYLHYRSVTYDEIKNLVKSCVSMCFEHDTDGD